MIKVVKERVDEEVEYYSDLSGRKIKLNKNEEETFSDPTTLKIRVPTFYWEDQSWTIGETDWQRIEQIEEIVLHLSTSESIDLLKYLQKKHPKNKNLKLEGFIKNKKYGKTKRK